MNRHVRPATWTFPLTAHAPRKSSIEVRLQSDSTQCLDGQHVDTTRNTSRKKNYPFIRSLLINLTFHVIGYTTVGVQLRRESLCRIFASYSVYRILLTANRSLIRIDKRRIRHKIGVPLTKAT